MRQRDAGNTLLSGGGGRRRGGGLGGLGLGSVFLFAAHTSGGRCKQFAGSLGGRPAECPYTNRGYIATPCPTLFPPPKKPSNFTLSPSLGVHLYLLLDYRFVTHLQLALHIFVLFSFYTDRGQG